MASNQMPTPAVLATSCLLSSLRWASVNWSHSGVPYSETRCGGMAYRSGSTGRSQSISVSGS